MAVMAETARTERIARELESLKDRQNYERIALPWKDEPGQVFPVVRLPLDCVVLNPSSHRIRAQLESDPRRGVVRSDPFTDSSQEILAELLRKIEGFEDLQANLADVGQSDAGVITRRGILVNANTRAVALRDLGKEYIKVAVLSENADPADLAKLELALQMKRDFKQDYTFTNQLLFVEDLRATYGYDDERVAKAMNLTASSDPNELKKGAKQAAAFTRMLAIVRDLQSRSGDRIPYSFFDDRRQALIDLDQAYEEHRNRDPEGARRMKDARLAALLTGSFYRDIRLIDHDAVIENVMPAIRENPDLGEELVAVIENAGQKGTVLAGISDLADEPPPTAEVGDLAPLVDLLASSFGEPDVTLAAADGESFHQVERSELVRQVGESFGDAFQQIRDDARAAKILNDPIKLVNDAKLQVDKALDAYRRVATTPGFQVGRLEAPLRRLRHAVEALEREIANRPRR
jgi:hypothetical protein